jgi:hypothetical protein
MLIYAVTDGEVGHYDIAGIFTSWQEAYDFALSFKCLMIIQVFEANNPAAGSGYYFASVRDRSLSGTLDYYDSVVPNPEYNRYTIASTTHRER